MLRNQKGITLVALVVTIIVLIILATISISVAMNGNIIGRAQQAEAWQANAEADWQAKDANVAAFIDEYVANATYTSTGSNATTDPNATTAE